MESTNREIVQHYKNYFEDHSSELLTWEYGPTKTLLPEFQVVRFSPGVNFDLWVYGSVGASRVEHADTGLFEFVVASPIESSRLVETLAMITYYHSTEILGFGHTLPIGEPWLDESKCTNWLVSLPYPFGEKLEIMPLGNSHAHAHVAWLLPITDKECEFVRKNGLEALEQRFDDVGLEYWNIDRDSVV